jgi:hypothetical protein
MRHKKIFINDKKGGENIIVTVLKYLSYKFERRRNEKDFITASYYCGNSYHDGNVCPDRL